MSVCVWLAVCAHQFECVRLWSESEWAISLAALLPPPSLSLSLSLSVSLRGSLSCGQQWKWARPCSKCGDLVANPTLFPPLSPLNDAYCILPRMRRRRMEPKLRQSTPPPPFPSFLLVCAHQPSGGLKQHRHVLFLSKGHFGFSLMTVLIHVRTCSNKIYYIPYMSF